MPIYSKDARNIIFTDLIKWWHVSVKLESEINSKQIRSCFLLTLWTSLDRDQRPRSTRNSSLKWERREKVVLTRACHYYESLNWNQKYTNTERSNYGKERGWVNNPLKHKCLTGQIKPSSLTTLTAVSFYMDLNLVLWGWGVEGKDHFHLTCTSSSQLIYPIPIPGRWDWGNRSHSRSRRLLKGQLWIDIVLTCTAVVFTIVDLKQMHC